MRVPAAKVEASERVLTTEEIANLPCTAKARGVVASRPGIIMASEVVSHSEEFGYLYRYDVAGTVERGLQRFSGRSVLILSSKDCEGFFLTSRPAFELPPEILEKL